MKKISFIFLLALLSLAASAEVVEYKGLWYNFNTEDNTAEVVASQSAPYSGNITIPASSYYQNKSYSVTSIGESAFEGCTGLTDVIIPSSVRTIEKGAFYECSGLTSVKIPNGVTKIGLGAFSVCTNLTCIIIPGSVTDIESYAFDYCTSLNHIVSESEQPAPFNNTVFDTHDDSYDVYTMATLVIPNGANSIYQSTAGWNNFSHVSEASEQKTRTIHIAKAGTLPNFISDMEKYLIEELSLSGDLNGTDIRFIRNMSGVDFDEIWHDEAESYRTQGILKALDLSNAHIVSGGDYIYAYGNGDYAAYFRTKNNTISTCMFYGVKLTSIVLPQSITCIESGAFHYVPTSASSYGRTKEFGGPVSLTIPSSVTSIGNGVFSGCTNLTNLIVVDGNVSYDSREGCNAIIEKTSNTLITGCKNTIIPNSVISIGQDAFRDCYGLTSVTIPNSVTSIGEFAFYGCSGLTSVHISDLVAWCNIKFNSNPLSNAHHLYIDGKEITNLVIPNSVTSIGSLAFSSCSSLTSVTIPNSVTSIGNYAFSGCSNLTTIISETEDPFGIGDKVFNSSDKDIYSTATLIVPSGKKATYQMTEGWKKFTNIVEIGEGGLIGQVFEAGGIFYKIQDNGANVTVVRGGTRYYKGDIIIPDIVNYNGKDYSVTSIGVEAFDDCNGMTSISIPSSISSIEIMAFQDCTRLSSVHITDLDAWCNISFGRSDSNPLSTAGHLYLNGEEIKDLVIPNGITSIKKASFYGCKGLTSVKIPNSVTSIGNYAFYGCTGLTSVTIGNSVTSIDEFAFYGCSGLTSITIPNSVTSIGSRAFERCSGLTSVTIPNSVKSIGDQAFFYCSGLISVTIPSSVTSISYGAFSGCSSLTTVTIPNSVTSIYSYAFCNCSGLTSVTIPNSVTSIGILTFYNCSGLTSVTIGNSVTSIGSEAFRDCSGLTSILSFNNTPPTCDETYVFDNVDKENCVVWVPKGSEAAYSDANGWKDFQNIKEIADGDVNLDEKVNRNDQNVLVAHIMGEKPEGFYEELADLNGDDDVDAADVVKLVNILNNGGLSMDSQFDFDNVDGNLVVASLTCTLNNKRNEAIQLTMCELYCKGNLASYKTFSDCSLAAGGSKECSFNNLTKHAAGTTDFTVCWHYTVNGESFVYRVH